MVEEGEGDGDGGEVDEDVESLVEAIAVDDGSIRSDGVLGFLDGERSMRTR